MDWSVICCKRWSRAFARMHIARRVSQSHCGVSHNLSEHCMEDIGAVWRLGGDHSLGTIFLGSHKLGSFARTCSSEDAYQPTDIVDYFYLLLTSRPLLRAARLVGKDLGRMFFGSYVINQMQTTRLVQWLLGIPNPKKKERKKDSRPRFWSSSPSQ